MSYRTFVAVLVAVSVFLNYVTTCAAADVITSGFAVSDDFSTYYDFELCPTDAKVSEIISDTLGSQHTIRWENPSDLPSGYKVEVYAVCEFEIYAADGFLRSAKNAGYVEMNAATNKNWQSVDTPYIKIYEDDALKNNSCIVDFDSLLSWSYHHYTDFASSFQTSTFYAFTVVVADYISSILGKEASEIINPYSYVVNENKCADFRFSKMKYYIRYKKAVEPQEPLQSDGKYHYYLETCELLNRAAGKPSNEFSGLPSGVYVGFTYTGGDEKIMDNGSHYLDYRIKYEIISPYPICLVSGEKLSNGIDYYYWYNTDGSVRYRPYNITIRTRTENGIQENNGNCQLYVLVKNNDNEDKVVNPSYGSRWDDIPNLAALDMVANSGTYQTNIPVFAAAFSSAADDYLLTGKLDSEENGNSWFMPSGGYQYGQLLQCTVGFADGGATLEDGSITTVLDGNNDTDNGWLKKIYYLLKDNLINDKGESWLAKIHKRLEWTNTYLKALIAENTISDLGAFITGFIADKLDAAVTAVMDTVNITVITAAGETITNAAKTKFPFSVYTNYVEIVTAFTAKPVTPCETVHMKFIKKEDGSYLVDEDITFDFERFDEIAKTTRSACYILFTLGLIPATRKYVQMVDGGKKT